jgi:hypothetical protein
MSDAVDSSSTRTRSMGAGVLWGVGGAASAIVALAIWALGYVGSLPFGIKPGANPQQGSNALLSLAAVWAAAAVAELVCAVPAKRHPALSLGAVAVAMVVALAASLLAAGNALALSAAVVAWLIPAVPLILGVVAALPSLRSRTGT